ncbi:hypothetical protein EVAR_50713_1 [Eumeta japonica]|uniref:Uncharacterized protein n=1 Tax=Eumeta variegata TaxID=151549 RepID=A0A4C1YRB5_EUMVA|nr:hypothetical protein EVAR_50713_1 [Eumeta japonica]
MNSGHLCLLADVHDAAQRSRRPLASVFRPRLRVKKSRLGSELVIGALLKPQNVLTSYTKCSRKICSNNRRNDARAPPHGRGVIIRGVRTRDRPADGVRSALFRRALRGSRAYVGAVIVSLGLFG